MRPDGFPSMLPGHIQMCRVIIHTREWRAAQIIEGQVNIRSDRSPCRAAVNAVRAQGPCRGTLRFVVLRTAGFDWARARVLEYLQQTGERLAAALFHQDDRSRRDGAGWGYEYLIGITTSATVWRFLRSLGLVPSYQIEIVQESRKSCEHRRLLRQYQVDWYTTNSAPLAAAFDGDSERSADSTNEVGGKGFEFKGADVVPGPRHGATSSAFGFGNRLPRRTKTGTPVRSGPRKVSFGPDIRRAWRSGTRRR